MIHANIVIIWVGYLLNKSKVIPSAAMAWWSLSGQNDANNHDVTNPSQLLRGTIASRDGGWQLARQGRVVEVGWGLKVKDYIHSFTLPCDCLSRLSDSRERTISCPVLRHYTRLSFSRSFFVISCTLAVSS